MSWRIYNDPSHAAVPDARASSPSAGARVLRGLLWLYQAAVSPFLGPACRFSPRCSEYGRIAIARYGARRGGWMTLQRLARCHPGHHGGWDPVP